MLKESREQVESLDERVRGRDNRIATLEQMLQSKGMNIEIETPVEIHTNNKVHLVDVNGETPVTGIHDKQTLYVVDSPSINLSPSNYDDETPGAYRKSLKGAVERFLCPPSSKIRTNPYITKRGSDKSGEGSARNSLSGVESPEVITCNKKDYNFDFNALYGNKNQKVGTSPVFFKGKIGETYTVKCKDFTETTYDNSHSLFSPEAKKYDQETQEVKNNYVSDSSGLGTSVSMSQSGRSLRYASTLRESPNSSSVKRVPRYERFTPGKYTPRRMQRQKNLDKAGKSPIVEVAKNVRASLSEVEIVGDDTENFDPPLSSTKHRGPSEITFAPPLSSTHHNPSLHDYTESAGLTFAPALSSTKNHIRQSDQNITTFDPCLSSTKRHQSTDSTLNTSRSPFKEIINVENREVLIQVRKWTTPLKEECTLNHTSPFLSVLNDKSPSPIRAILAKEVKKSTQVKVRLNKASRLRLQSPVPDRPKSKRRKINLTQSSLFEDGLDLESPSKPPANKNKLKKNTKVKTSSKVGKIAKRKSGIGIRSILNRYLKH